MTHVTEAEIGGNVGYANGDFLYPDRPLILDNKITRKDYELQGEDALISQKIDEQNKELMTNLSSPSTNTSFWKREYLGAPFEVTALVVLLFILVLVFAYMQSREIKKLHKLVRTLLELAKK